MCVLEKVSLYLKVVTMCSIVLLGQIQVCWKNKRHRLQQISTPVETTLVKGGGRFVVSGFFPPFSTLKDKAVIQNGIRSRAMNMHFAKKTFSFLKLKPCLHCI